MSLPAFATITRDIHHGVGLNFPDSIGLTIGIREPDQHFALSIMEVAIQTDCQFHELGRVFERARFRPDCLTWFNIRKLFMKSAL
jgi:hypothetical protein